MMNKNKMYCCKPITDKVITEMESSFILIKYFYLKSMFDYSLTNLKMSEWLIQKYARTSSEGQQPRGERV